MERAEGVEGARGERGAQDAVAPRRRGDVARHARRVLREQHVARRLLVEGEELLEPGAGKAGPVLDQDPAVLLRVDRLARRRRGLAGVLTASVQVKACGPFVGGSVGQATGSSVYSPMPMAYGWEISRAPASRAAALRSVVRWAGMGAARRFAADPDGADPARRTATGAVDGERRGHCAGEHEPAPERAGALGGRALGGLARRTRPPPALLARAHRAATVPQRRAPGRPGDAPRWGFPDDNPALGADQAG